ncbi:MAG: aldehyde dehydrogenase family protein [Bacteroidetes bacterium]|nr:MAG: aldehyde dehydrogenase family protein [Bacteroidota bacterium]
MEQLIDQQVNPAEIQRIFELQRQHAPALVHTTAKERKAKIKKILDYTLGHLSAIEQAMYDDFQKPAPEVIVGEIIGVKTEAKYAMRKLGRWMRPHKVGTPLSLIGTSSYIRYEPKGNCLIISPWNYPYNLAIKPLIACIAAGNTAILKPSEMTPHTSGLIKQMIAELFPEEEVAVFEGDYRVAQNLLALPFNHVFFTGSPQVGKIVMEAAAKHLASVTLELGGKSPAIVDETANIRDIAPRLAWGKWLNNGQTCIAPDYVLVHESKEDELLQALTNTLDHMYQAPEGIENSDSYCRIVNERHFGRLKGILDDALAKGAQLVYGGQTDASEQFIAPTVLTGVTDDMRIMQEEIFGPLLPVIPYRDNNEVLSAINQREKPLALYVASRKKKNVNFFLTHTTSGDAVVNDYLIHYSHPALPFGGVNNSGIGKSGGFHGFREFSNERGVLVQKFGSLKPIFPPYTEKVNKIVRFLLKLV